MAEKKVDWAKGCNSWKPSTQQDATKVASSPVPKTRIKIKVLNDVGSPVVWGCWGNHGLAVPSADSGARPWSTLGHSMNPRFLHLAGEDSKLHLKQLSVLNTPSEVSCIWRGRVKLWIPRGKLFWCQERHHQLTRSSEAWLPFIFSFWPFAGFCTSDVLLPHKVQMRSLSETCKCHLMFL